MPNIFISHATADQALAKLLVNFLKEAIGVPERGIFCSSLEGHDIPLGSDFSEYIRTNIERPDLVILLLTPTYMERPFCLMELGATWALAHHAIPIIVPPTGFAEVTRTLGPKQAWDITDGKGLSKFRDQIKSYLPPELLEYRSDSTWDAKRDDWKERLPLVLQALPGPQNVDKRLLEQAKDDISVRDRTISELSTQLEAQKALASQMQVQIEQLTGTGRVLIIEEERLIAIDLEQLLCEAGFKVIGVATTADDGRKMAERHQPDFIVTEIKFKDADGKQLRIDISANLDCEIIMVTAHSDLLLKEPSPTGYLVEKPFKPDVFIIEMMKAARERKEQAERRAALQRAR